MTNEQVYSVMVLLMLEFPMVAIPYNAKFWQGKTLANSSKRDFGEEYFGKCVEYLKYSISKRKIILRLARLSEIHVMH